MGSKLNQYLLIVLTFVILAGVASAEGISSRQEGNIVWLTESEVEYSYSCQKISNLTISSLNSEKSILLRTERSKGNLTTQDFKSKGLGPGDFNLDLNCENSTYSDTQNVKIRNLTAYSVEGGKSYFGEKTSWGEFTLPPKVGLKVEGGVLNPSKVEISSQTSSISVKKWNHDTGILEVFVGRSYDPSKSKNDFKVEYDAKEKVGFNLEVPIEVYPWKPIFVGEKLPRKIEYSKLDSLDIDINVAKGLGFSETLYEENFVVSIKDLKTGEVIYEEKEWVKTSNPKGKADYKLELSNIPDLQTGKYELLFKIRNKERSAPIDSIRVVKSLNFDGKIVDSSNRGVKTKMELRRGKRTIPVETSSDGSYSRQIKEDKFDTMELKFFDRAKAQPDTKLVLNNVDLDSQASKGAIKYQYWKNPSISVTGLNPVNMMAIKFGHQINGNAKSYMSFNPENVDPENLKVFECKDWNFLGQRCLGDWERVDDESVSINYADWQVQISDMSLHHISEETGGKEKDILMNAYVVGTNSGLTLKGENKPLTINSERIASGEQLKITGNVISTQGRTVKGAKVNLSLMNGSSLVKSYEASTNAAGKFKIEGKVPDNPGEYSITVKAEKNPYKDFSTDSNSKIEVYLKKGMTLENPQDMDLTFGERKSINFEIENTGQVKIEDLSYTINGLDDKLYRQKSLPQNLEPGEKKDVVYSVKIPRSYCPSPCTRPPRFSVRAEGQTNEESISASTTLFTQLSDNLQKENVTGYSENASSVKSRENEKSESSLLEEKLITPTGNFLKRQSSLNIALGIVMVFTVLLAIAVKKKRNSSSRSMQGRASGFGQYSNSNGFSSQTQEVQRDEFKEDTSWKKDIDNKPELNSEENEGREQEDNTTKDESNGEFVCEETGETFDTKAALELHKKMRGIE